MLFLRITVSFSLFIYAGCYVSHMGHYKLEHHTFSNTISKSHTKGAEIQLEPHKNCSDKNIDYFFRSGVSGALSCSLTHSLMVPIDVIKTKMQTDSSFGSMNAASAFVKVLNDGGSHALLSGLQATLSGYFMQGACKFGFYEYFKHTLSRLVDVRRFRFLVLLLSASFAEVIASCVLCPLEVGRVYTVLHSSATQQTNILGTLLSLIKQNGVGYLFQGLPLILLRQVPYTCSKLVCYEVVSDLLHKISLQNKEDLVPRFGTWLGAVTSPSRRRAGMEQTTRQTPVVPCDLESVSTVPFPSPSSERPSSNYDRSYGLRRPVFEEPLLETAPVIATTNPVFETSTPSTPAESYAVPDTRRASDMLLMLDRDALLNNTSTFFYLDTSQMSTIRPAATSQSSPQSLSTALPPPGTQQSCEADKGPIIPFFSGIVAGVLAAIVSQPADFLFSLSVSGRSAATPEITAITATGMAYILQLMRIVGLKRCFVGLGPRVVMVALLTALQFFFYETFRKLLIRSTTNGL